MRSAVVAVFLALGSGAACGDDDGLKRPGEPCEYSQAGAATCESGVCIAMQCLKTNERRNVCGGASCAVTQKCPGGQFCVPIPSSSEAYCVPTTICP